MSGCERGHESRLFSVWDATVSTVWCSMPLPPHGPGAPKIVPRVLQCGHHCFDAFHRRFRGPGAGRGASSGVSQERRRQPRIGASPRRRSLPFWTRCSSSSNARKSPAPRSERPCRPGERAAAATAGRGPPPTQARTQRSQQQQRQQIAAVARALQLLGAQLPAAPAHSSPTSWSMA